MLSLEFEQMYYNFPRIEERWLQFFLLIYIAYLWTETELKPDVFIGIPNSFSNTSTTNHGTLKTTLSAQDKS